MGWLNKLFNLDSFKGASESEAYEVGVQTGTPSYGHKESQQVSSGNSASKRLKLVLMHDRTQLSPAMMEQMRDELVEVISRYVVIDKNALDINLESESNTIALVANIPVLRTRSGIDETLTQQHLVQPSEVLPNAKVSQADSTTTSPKSNPAATSPASGTLPSQQPFANALNKGAETTTTSNSF